MKVAWWKDVPNFGDALTPVILKRLAEIDSEWSEPNDAEFIGIGSYLEKVKPTYKGIIWGTGRMYKGSTIDLSNARVLALRGKLTQESVRSDCELLGDPGLLCRFIVKEPKEKTYEIGIIPHWNDWELKNIYPKHHLIDIKGDIDTVISETMSCEKIISSSLHGLVLADALGIPRMWSNSIRNPGSGFKFMDYQSVFGDEIYPDVWYTADHNKVKNISDALLKALHEL